MYYPTSRVLTLLELLQSRDGLSNLDIAARLEVSPRSVRRYVEQLQSMGIPVEGRRGRHGGYRLRPGYRLPPLTFNDDEAVSLVLGLRAAKHIGASIASPAAESALAKLERVFPEHLVSQLRFLETTLHLTDRKEPTLPNSSTVLALGRAAFDRRRVRIEYGDHAGQASSREVDPYGIAVHEGRWYLLGHCHLRSGLRMFRVDRIEGLTTLEDGFQRPEGWDTLESILERMAVWAARWTVTARLDLSLETARQRVPQRWVKLEADGDATRLSFGVGSLEWAARALIRLECRFTVIEPVDLRSIVRRVALELLETH